METGKTTLKFGSSGVQIALSGEEHINKLPFMATFMIIGSPSDGVPCGADLPVMLDMDEAQKCVNTMDLMAIDCMWSDWFPEDCMTGHDTQNKIGVVEQAYIEGNEMKIKGFVYAMDFPEIAYFIKNATPALGFSMECIASTEEKEDGFEHLSDVTFTGVAILFKNLAAYEDTYIDYLAAAKKKKEDEKLTKEEMEQLMASVKDTVEASQKQFADKFVDIATKLGELQAGKTVPKAGEDKAALEKLEAEKKQLADEKAALEAAQKDIEEKAKTEKETLEKQVADLQAQRKSASFAAKRTGFGEHNDDFKDVWKNGYKEGIPMAFQKLKDIVKEGK